MTSAATEKASKMVRVTVCEFMLDGPLTQLKGLLDATALKEHEDLLEKQWAELVAHVNAHDSTVILLPEFFPVPWIFATPKESAAVWKAAVALCDRWIKRFSELGDRIVCSSRLVTLPNGPAAKSSAVSSTQSDASTKLHRYNEAYIWTRETGARPCHLKRYLPEEDGFHEESWYSVGDGSFDIVQVPIPKHGGAVNIGFQLCSELWFFQHSRSYGQKGCHLVLSPRATEPASVPQWIVGGQSAAIVAGAFVLSSNRASPVGDPKKPFGGTGYVIDPDGKLLDTTRSYSPFLTLEVDLTLAEKAKKTYPRYVKE